MLTSHGGTGGTKHGTHLKDVHCLLSLLGKPGLLVVQKIDAGYPNE